MNREWAQQYCAFRDKCSADDDVCQTCLSDYEDNPKAQTKHGTILPPTCELSTKYNLEQTAEQPEWKNLSSQQQADYKIAKDPIYWAAARLRSLRDTSQHWTPEWYQVEPLRCTARKLLLLFGRQLGKTEVLAVKILFRLDTRRDYKIVVVCPFQSQVNMIYTRLVALIEASPELSQRIKRKRENPDHEIQFDNNSFVRLFTAGEQTGKGASNVRGQSADWLVFDEADYLSDATITTTLAILTRALTPELFVSSTPTGKRGRFYDWATDPSQGFRVLHCTSMEAPEWNEADELFLRKTYSAAYFAHEYLAEFGSLEAGVFKRQYIEAKGVIQEYDIDNPVPRDNEIYVLGVDWNSKGTGGVLCVVGFNPDAEAPNGQRFRIAYRQVVDPEQWTQTAAVEAVVRLNRAWNPRYIYVDQGHGEMQVEVLQLYGLNHRKTGLHKKVRGVEMQANTTIRDPLLKKDVKKQTKNLMVEICTARLEQGQIILPKSEDHQHGLIGQMREYEVEYVGRGGKKVYSGEKEHLLTAWMLSIFGFVMEMSDIRKTRSVSEVILLDSNLENALLKVIREKTPSKVGKKKKVPKPQSRTGQKKTLDVVDAIQANRRGYVPASAKRASKQPLGRKKW
jgi:hypothetical protein